VKRIVFLGPSLPVRDAKRLLPGADFRPPARQGDVFRAVDARPDVIVLIDGIFESAPSVWHHELIAAHASGITVLGASSMGALRAAELPGVVKPIGEIARRFASGAWNDDAAVALLHADASQGYRALTVPWVNVWATARAARLSASQKRALCTVAEAQFYQARTWDSVLAALGWSTDLCARVLEARVDLKAQDARRALAAAAKIRARRPAVPAPFSSFVRRTRLDAQRVTPHPDPLPRGGEGARVGTLLLADFARQAGIVPERQAVARWLARLHGPFAPDQLAAWAEALALEELVLASPEHFVSDGPSRLEGAALLTALNQGR
jgi:hypothetical protein